MTERFANNYQPTIQDAIDSVTDPATFTLSPAPPAALSSGNWRLLIDSEILLVTSVAGADVTAQRAQEGTAKAAHTLGAQAYHVLSAGSLAQAIIDHEALADPHTGYQRESEKGAANGYASLDAGAKLPATQLPAHASTHASAGSDPVTPSAIGAAASSHDHDAQYAKVSGTETLIGEKTIKPPDTASRAVVIAANPNQAGNVFECRRDDNRLTGYFNEKGELRAQPGAANSVPVRVKQFDATQSARLTEWTNAGNTLVLAEVGPNGEVRSSVVLGTDDIGSAQPSLASPVDGDILVGTGAVWVRQAGAWRRYVQQDFLLKSADQSISSQPALQDITDLSFSVAANEKWWFDGWLLVSAANATMDVIFGLNVSGTVTSKWGVGPNNAPGTLGGWTVTGTTGSPVGLLDETQASAAVGTKAGLIGVSLAGLILGGASGGTWGLRFAQKTSDAGALTIQADSVVFLRRVA